MRDLATYAFVNARIRGLISKLLDARALGSLAAAEDPPALARALESTPYGPWAALASDPAGTASFERELGRADLLLFRRIASFLPAGPERTFTLETLGSLEAAQLKTALRIWHNRLPVRIEDRLIDPAVLRPVDYAGVARASSIEEVIVLLSGTPYAAPVAAAREHYRRRASVFPLEASVDRDFHTRLMAAAGRLSRSDRATARAVVGTEIDILNIGFFVRLRRYHALPMGEMLEWFIPGGLRVHERAIRDLYVTDGLGQAAASVSIGPYAAVRSLAEGDIERLDAFLQGVFAAEIRRLLGGFPFGIGTVIAYLALKRRETAAVVSAVQARRRGWTAEQALAAMGI